MKKPQYLREEDYWVFPLTFITTLCLAIAIYASVLVFRGPTLLVGVTGLFLSYLKIKTSYSQVRAYAHTVLTLLMSFGVAWLFYVVTN